MGGGCAVQTGTDGDFLRGEPLCLVCSLLLSCMLVFCHRGNIARLIRGEENKLDFKKINKLKKDGKNHE